MLYGDAVINFHIHMDAYALSGLGDPASRIAELNSGADHGLLSTIQVHIFANRLSDPFLWTYARIRKEYHITRDEAVHHTLVQTACGLFWELGMDGGRDPYLSPLDIPKFRDTVLERAVELNCITWQSAVRLTCDLAMHRRRVAAMPLQAARLEFHAELLEVRPPCSEWLNAISQELGFKICSSQEIDAARPHFCDHSAISMFFVTFQAVTDGRDRRLVFNADET
jgi:hypothetical protein